MPKTTKKIKHPKYIFVVGGVMSGVGKGIASASIGKILQSRGFEVTNLKIDPYVNVDAGTMNPTEHGEVFVLDDGVECDQDMGNYERFLERDLTGANYMTTGSVYLSVINRERSMGYGGRCVEVVPHIPLEVLGRIDEALRRMKAEIAITEIGGTVGEYQNILFLEAVRMLRVKNPEDVALVLVSYLPIQGSDSELKTKPTQHAVRALNAAGLQPDVILARASVPLDMKRKQKIAFNCNLREKDIISAPDVKSIYDVPLNYEKDKLSDIICEKLHIRPRRRDLSEWRTFSRATAAAHRPVRIGIAGKYFGSGQFILADSYISVIESVKHAAAAVRRAPEIHWLDAEQFVKGGNTLKELGRYDGIIVPGGFGSRGIEGKIQVIKYCREHKIPYFGLCYGMQLAVVEFTRHVLGMKRANTTEVDPETPDPVIDVMPEQKKNLREKNYGATMRLGAYPALLKKGTRAARAYGRENISERHRHRYEVNPEYIDRLTASGLVFSGVSPDGRLMEIAELPSHRHPFFMGTQFHPELKSRPLHPHPLFLEFVRAAARRRP
ncbi:MAG TPA: CTP synthase [Candidatus Paceibacterota bacterium]|nr:CTP synthase [Candidatus Paceibacterota bacterium]